MCNCNAELVHRNRVTPLGWAFIIAGFFLMPFSLLLYLLILIAKIVVRVDKDFTLPYITDLCPACSKCGRYYQSFGNFGGYGKKRS